MADKKLFRTDSDNKSLHHEDFHCEEIDPNEIEIVQVRMKKALSVCDLMLIDNFRFIYFWPSSADW